MTKRRMHDFGISCDLVSVNQPPLHGSPCFIYPDPNLPCFAGAVAFDDVYVHPDTYTKHRKDIQKVNLNNHNDDDPNTDIENDNENGYVYVYVNVCVYVY